MYTKEDLKKQIGLEEDKIQNITRNAEERFKQMQADVNDMIGQCKGKIIVYKEILAELEAPPVLDALKGDEASVS